MAVLVGSAVGPWTCRSTGMPLWICTIIIFACSVCVAFSVAFQTKGRESEREQEAFVHGNNGHCQGFIFISRRAENQLRYALRHRRDCFYSVHCIHTRLSRFISHSLYSQFTLLDVCVCVWRPRKVDFDFLRTQAHSAHMPNGSWSTHSNTQYTGTHMQGAHGSEGGRFISLFIYLTVQMLQKYIVGVRPVLVPLPTPVTNETESKQCRPFAGRNT